MCRKERSFRRAALASSKLALARSRTGPTGLGRWNCGWFWAGMGVIGWYMSKKVGVDVGFCVVRAGRKLTRDGN